MLTLEPGIVADDEWGAPRPLGAGPGVGPQWGVWGCPGGDIWYCGNPCIIRFLFSRLS